MTGFTAAETRRRAKAHRQALITHLFDNGYAHIDEPRILIHKVSFYPSDLLPEHKEMLRSKIAIARASDNSGLSINTDLPGIRWPDQKHLRKEITPLADDDEANLDRLIREYAERILSKFEAGRIAIFNPGLLQRSRSQARQDFIDFMQEVPTPLLEYAVRSKLHIHLNHAPFDPTCQPPNLPEGLRQDGLHITIRDTNGAPLMNQITINDLRQHPKEAQYSFCHEAAHAVMRATTPEQQQPWNAAYDAFLACLRQSLELPASAPFAQLRAAALNDHGKGDLSDVHRVIGEHLLPPPEAYESHEAQREEVFANLMRGALMAPGQGPQASNEDPPLMQALNHAIATTRALFDARHASLEHIPLPQASQQRGAGARR